MLKVLYDPTNGAWRPNAAVALDTVYVALDEWLLPLIRGEQEALIQYPQLVGMGVELVRELNDPKEEDLFRRRVEKRMQAVSEHMPSRRLDPDIRQQLADVASIVAANLKLLSSYSNRQ